MSMPPPELIVALDVDTLDTAKKLVDILYPAVKLFKIGSQLFTAYGPEAVRMVREKGGRVFLDLKFHDIPQTVCNASSSASTLRAGSAGVFMMTVHTAGGVEMMKAAVRGAADKAKELRIERPLIIGVTVLTSDQQGAETEKVVVERAVSAQKAGLDGVVCSVHEAAAVRKACGRKFIIVTPGIRAQAETAGDQKRIATVEEAVKAGSDYLVIGRPIVQAADPLKAAQQAIAVLPR